MLARDLVSVCYICSSHLGLIRCIIRHVIVRSMQEVKAVHDTARNGHDIQLPNKLADSDNTGPKQGSPCNEKTASGVSRRCLPRSFSI